MPMYVIADAQAGIKCKQPDWYNMCTILRACAGYTHITDFNPEFHMDFDTYWSKLVTYFNAQKPMQVSTSSGHQSLKVEC